MGEPKPIASLSSSLLARKGQAKPAMRPQGFGGFSSPFNGHDDLGWNDMGHDVSSPVPIHQDVHPAAEPRTPLVVRQRAELAEELNVVPEDFAVPPLAEVDEVEAAEVVADAEEAAAVTDVGHVVDQIAIGDEVEEEAVPAEPVAEIATSPASRPIPTVAVARARKAAKGRKTKAAFTLRLDPERHLKLRLACAVSRDSAQAIVTEALDRFLATLPEIEALASKVPGSTH